MSSSSFQLLMNQTIRNLKQTVCRIDNTLIKLSPNDHLEILEIAARAVGGGVKANRSKCQSAVDYMGHRINGKGIHSVEKKGGTYSMGSEVQHILFGPTKPLSAVYP